MRSRDLQPVTKNVQSLLIGLSNIKLGPQEDSTLPSASLVDMGSLTAASFKLNPKMKKHEEDYPKATDDAVIEDIEASYSLTLEELGDPSVFALVTAAIASVEDGVNYFMQILATAEFATGGVQTLLTPSAQLMPKFSLKFTDDWNSIDLEFKPRSNDDYTNQDLVYVAEVPGVLRNVTNQAVTKSPTNLSIGRFQVRITAFRDDPDVTDVVSTLSKDDSIGAVAAASIDLSSSLKELRTGYPTHLKEAFVESSDLTVRAEPEEISKALFDDLMAAAYSRKFVSAQLVANLATGDSVSFWFPNCRVIPTISFDTKDDWHSLPFELMPVRSPDKAINRVYPTLIAGA